MSGPEESSPLLKRDLGDPADTRPGLTPQRALIIPCMVIYFFGIGITIYAPSEYIQNYFQEKANTTNMSVNPCHANKSDPLYIRFTNAQKEAAIWINYYTISQNIPAIFMTLLWTSYSDAIGRKSLFILCSVGNVMKLIVVTVVIGLKASVDYMLIGNIIEGLTGSYMTMFALMFSYVADITKNGGNRTVYIVFTELILGITITISSFTTGFFIKSSGFFYPMVLAVILTFVSVIMMIFLLPETRSQTGRRFSSKVIFSYVAAAFTLYTNPGSKLKRAKYIILIASFLFLAIPTLNRGTLETLYQLGQPFCWSPTKIGYFGTIKIGLATFFSVFGVLVLKKCFADDSIAAIGAVSGIVSFIVEGLANTEEVLYTVPLLACMTFVPIPMIRSLMSHMTPADKQGALFASIGAVETLCNLIGSLTNNLVYAATVSVMNGFAFLLLALITAVGLIIMLVYMCVSRQCTEEGEMNNIAETEVVT